MKPVGYYVAHMKAPHYGGESGDIGGPFKSQDAAIRFARSHVKETNLGVYRVHSRRTRRDLKTTIYPQEHAVTKKSPAQLDREIAEALQPSRRKVAGYSNYGGGGFAPMGAPPPSPGGVKSRLMKPRRGHATKKAFTAKPGTNDKITIDQLAEFFELPDWDKIDELNQHHYWEMARGAATEDEEIEAQQAAAEEVYAQWYDAVENTASQLFEEHGLKLEPTGKQGTPTRRYDFKIVPQTTWDAAANKIRETINGVGHFHFNNLKEFLRSGPYTARAAVLSHLQYIKRFPAVYGRGSARQMYERAWR